MVCFPFTGDSVGGSHLSALLLIERLPDHGIEPLVVVHASGPLMKLLEGRGISYEMLEAPGVLTSEGRVGYVGATIWEVPRLAMYLHRRNVSLVHTNEIRVHKTWMLAAKMAGVPHVWHQRTRLYAPRLGRWLLRAPDRIVSVSHYVTSSLPPFARDKAIVIPNPFDLRGVIPDRARSRHLLLREVGATTDERLVGFVGNLTDQKRPLLFVEMAANLSAAFDEDIRFLMFGADRQGNARRVRDLSRALGIDDQVHLMGFRSPIEVAMAGTDVLVAPGVGDGLGRSLVEAMLVGTPVVAARSGGHVEVIELERTGLLVEPDDVSAFAAAVRRVLNHPELAERLAVAGRIAANERFSARRHVVAVVEEYETLLSK